MKKERDYANGMFPQPGVGKSWANELTRGRVPGPKMVEHTQVQPDSGPGTVSVHAGTYADPVTGAITTPVFQTTTFLFDEKAYEAFDQGTTRDVPIYSRYGNPGQWAVQEKIATLEGAESSVVFASGMAAITTTLTALTNSGGHIISALDVYGGTYSFLRDEVHQLGREITLVESTNIAAIKSAVQPNTQVLFFETLTNPLLKALPLIEVSKLCEELDLLLVVDNTFLGPTKSRPIVHGADIVIHSATKYLNGHSDLVAGVASGSRKYIDRVWGQMLKYGGQLDPFSCFLLERGLKTLHLRMNTATENAVEIVRFLEQRDDINAVHHPTAQSYPYPWWPEFSDGPGAMVSFEVTGGDKRAAEFLDSLNIPLVATSLGGVESLISLPSTTSHSLMTKSQRETMGIKPGLIRLSVGVEDLQDLLNDIENALDKTGETA